MLIHASFGKHLTCPPKRLSSSAMRRCQRKNYIWNPYARNNPPSIRKVPSLGAVVFDQWALPTHIFHFNTLDDIWVLSDQIDFDSPNTTFARSTYYGPNSDHDVELAPLG